MLIIEVLTLHLCYSNCFFKSLFSVRQTIVWVIPPLRSSTSQMHLYHYFHFFSHWLHCLHNFQSHTQWSSYFSPHWRYHRITPDSQWKWERGFTKSDMICTDHLNTTWPPDHDLTKPDWEMFWVWHGKGLVKWGLWCGCKMNFCKHSITNNTHKSKV